MICIFDVIIDYHHILTLGFLLAEVFHTHTHTLLGRFETSLLSLVGISFREVSENPRKGFKHFNLGSCFILLRSGVWLLANQLRVVG